MKKIVLVFTVLLCFNMSAQEKKLKSNTFLRVYNLNGKKIAKGKLLATDASSLTLKKNKKVVSIILDSIGSIKSRRSVGSNIFTGAAIGAGTIIVLNSGSGESPFEGYVGLGTLTFTGIGAGLGAITSIGRDSRVYIINGDSSNWEAFRNLIISSSD